MDLIIIIIIQIVYKVQEKQKVIIKAIKLYF